MCDHKRKEVSTYPDEEGFAVEKCLICGKIIKTVGDTENKIPYTYNDLKIYGLKHHKITPLSRPNNLDEYVSPLYPKLERIRF